MEPIPLSGNFEGVSDISSDDTAELGPPLLPLPDYPHSDFPLSDLLEFYLGTSSPL